MSQRLIILRGAPASGKSTIAKSYRDIEKRIAWIKVDNFKDFFSDSSDMTLPFVNGSAIATLEYLLNKKFTVVLDGIFQGTTTIDDALEIAEELNIHAKVFEIEIPLAILVNRDMHREGVRDGIRAPLGEETIRKIIDNQKHSPYLNAIKLDTEKYSPKECKEIIEKSFI